MAELIRGLQAGRVAANLAGVRERVAAAARRVGRDAAGVEVVAATKYVAAEEMGVLAEAGVRLVGENRAQDLQAKHAAYGPAFTWDFIGHLQSRKVRTVAPLVRRIHSAGGASVLRQLERHAERDGGPRLEVLIEVNLSGEEGKSGIDPGELDRVLEAHRALPSIVVGGLMTMPPLAADPQDSRRWFAQLRELAAARDLPQLSMGTTQDFEVAVEEGATSVRVGTVLFG